jgi:hypothetical protein
MTDLSLPNITRPRMLGRATALLALVYVVGLIGDFSNWQRIQARQGVVVGALSLAVANALIAYLIWKIHSGRNWNANRIFHY